MVDINSRINGRFGDVRPMALALFVFLAGCGPSKTEMPENLNYQIEARKALAAGEKSKAIELLTAAIQQEPTVEVLLERATLNLDLGYDQDASADCDQAAEIEPSNRDIEWLRGEIEKPEAKRFQGRNKFPPSYSK